MWFSSLGIVPSIWRAEVLRMLSPPLQQEDVAVVGEDGGADGKTSSITAHTYSITGY